MTAIFHCKVSGCNLLIYKYLYYYSNEKNVFWFERLSLIADSYRQQNGYYWGRVVEGGGGRYMGDGQMVMQIDLT